MKKAGIVFFLIAFIGAVVATGYYLYSKNNEKPVIFQTKKAEVRDVIKKTVATGSVVPRKEIEIKPQVSGLIRKLYVEAGDQVKSGDLIATVRVIPNMVSLNEAENRVTRSEINFKNSKRDFDRNKGLLEEGVIAEATFQTFELAFQNAEQEVEAAKDNLQIVREGTTTRFGKAATTNIRSTISGMVLEVPVEEGNSVIEANTFNDGTTIAIVADMTEMIFKGMVDESEVGKIRPGMDLLLSIGAIENQTFDAILEYIAPKGVEENGAIQFEIRAAVNLQKDQFIRAGYSANADIVLDRRDSVLTINEGLLLFEGTKTYLEIETAPQTFDKREVKTGLSDGIHIEVLAGVTATDKIKDPNPVDKPKVPKGGGRSH